MVLIMFLTLVEILKSFSPFSMNTILAVGLLYIAFIMLRYVPCIPSFSQDFCHEQMLDFVKDIFHFSWDDHGASVLESVYVSDCIY